MLNGKYERGDIVLIQMHQNAYLGVITDDTAEVFHDSDASKHFRVSWWMENKEWFHSTGAHEAASVQYVGTVPPETLWDIPKWDEI